MSLYMKLNDIAKETLEAKSMVVVPPPSRVWVNQGLQMQLELQDGSFEYRKLQTSHRSVGKQGNQTTQLQRLMTPFRASVPQVLAPVNRIKASHLV